MAKKNEKEQVKDPWEVDPEEVDRAKREHNIKGSGVLCPRRNVSMEGECGVCNYILTEIFPKKYPKGHPHREWGVRHGSKGNIYFGVVFEENPNTPFTLKVGKKVGSQIIDNVKTEWTDALYPMAGKGRILKIKKVQEKGENYPTYQATVSLEHPTWGVPDDVWRKKVVNLDQSNLIEMVKSGKFDDTNYIDISGLKVGDSLSFRLLPPWQNGELGNKNRIFFQYLYMHWGVTQGMVDGTDPVIWKDEVTKPEDVDDVPWNDQKPQKEKPKQMKGKTPPCFGNPQLFEADDETCIDCFVFDKCNETVTADIPF